MRSLFFIFCIAVVVVACKKKELDDNEIPKIIFNSPSEGKSCKYGDTIKIDVDVTDNKRLHEFKCELKCDGYEVFKYKYNLNGNTYKYTKTYKLDIPATNEFEIKIEVEDEAGNKNYVTRAIDVHP